MRWIADFAEVFASERALELYDRRELGALARMLRG